MLLSRRNLILGSAGLACPGLAQKPAPQPLPAELVREFVIAGHANLDKVKALLSREPGLLNATTDWGKGDFESAIGGAGHMGRRDIALFLIERGARYDIFVAAMLGELDVIKAMLAAHPKLVEAKGPHNISLMTHAEKGGEGAKAIVALLKDLSDSSP